MADYEPEYGVPRLVTMESDVHSDSLARRGLAFGKCWLRAKKNAASVRVTHPALPLLPRCVYF